MPQNPKLQYQTKTQPTFVPPESITEDKWHFAWSEPVRIKLRLLDGQQQFFAAPIRPVEIIYEDKWNFPWSEPVRVRARTAETTIAFTPTQPVPPPLTWPIYTLVGSLEIKTEMVGY